MYDNQLKGISGLEPVTGLRVLMLGKNQITKIENLDCVPKLDVLDLHSNRIRVIENLQHLRDLRVLNLASNQVFLSIDNRYGHAFKLSPAFSSSCIYSHQISSILPLSGLSSLVELNLRRNQLRSFDDISADNFVLPQLQKLFLSNNAITQVIFQIKGSFAGVFVFIAFDSVLFDFCVDFY
jgi:Leucine-rich repeat (LRR) protein